MNRIVNTVNDNLETQESIVKDLEQVEQFKEGEPTKKVQGEAFADEQQDGDAKPVAADEKGKGVDTSAPYEPK